MRVDCVMLGVENPFWSTQCNKFVSSFFNVIDTQRCTEQFKSSFFETEPHVTLLYGLEKVVGPNSMYVFLKLLQRDLYLQLKQDTSIVLDNVVLDWFKSDRGYVLKINLDQSDKVQLMRSYRDALIDKYGITSEIKEYHPHLTITYLDAGLTDDDLQLICNSFDLSKFNRFNINRFLISEGSAKGEQREFYIGG